jgi:hypothetical protein
MNRSKTGIVFLKNTFFITKLTLITFILSRASTFETVDTNWCAYTVILNYWTTCHITSVSFKINYNYFLEKSSDSPRAKVFLELARAKYRNLFNFLSWKNYKNWFKKGFARKSPMKKNRGLQISLKHVFSESPYQN